MSIKRKKDNMKRNTKKRPGGHSFAQWMGIAIYIAAGAWLAIDSFRDFSETHSRRFLVADAIGLLAIYFVILYTLADFGHCKQGLKQTRTIRPQGSGIKDTNSDNE